LQKLYVEVGNHSTEFVEANIRAKLHVFCKKEGWNLTLKVPKMPKTNCQITLPNKAQQPK
jgi:hypothetical protein